jgi:hypothetical protein
VSGVTPAASIPELLGHPPAPYDREWAYSTASYQAQYCLTEDEAKDITERNRRHADIDLELSQRYMTDLSYRKRINDARQDITATEPSDDVKRLMEKAPTQPAKPGGVSLA